MVQVRVLGVALDAAGQHIVLLKPLLVEPGEGRVLPVWIGGQEATSILIAVEGQQAPRPLSHDLITTLFAAVGARVERVDVTRIEEGTFYAELTLSTPSGPQVLDSRPCRWASTFRSRSRRNSSTRLSRCGVVWRFISASK